MPRIQAPTLRENRELRSVDLRRAARDLVVARGPAAVSMADAAQRAGLARPTAYDYFPTTETLLAAVVADDLDTWASAVHEACRRASSPGLIIDAFVETSVRLIGVGCVSHQVIACATWLNDHTRAELATRTDFLVSPLRDALAASGADHADLAAGVVLAAVIAAGTAAAEGAREAEIVALRVVRGLVPSA